MDRLVELFSCGGSFDSFGRFRFEVCDQAVHTMSERRAMLSNSQVVENFVVAG